MAFQNNFLLKTYNIMNRPYRLLLYVSFAIVFPLVFLAATCEPTKEPPVTPPLPQTCKADSINTLLRGSRDSSRYWKEQALGFKNVVAINHVTIGRLNSSMQDLAFDLNASLSHEKDIVKKYQAALDTAVAQRERFRKKLIACRCTKP
jgi:hypothetical protein